MTKVYEKLESQGLLEYGSVIKAETIREMAGISIPKIGTMDQFKEAALAELSITDAIRSKLISKGKYFAASKNSYRVLMPSENADQVRKYMKGADRKLKRAIRLHDNTPKDFRDCKDKVRLHTRQESIKEQERKNKLFE